MRKSFVFVTAILLALVPMSVFAQDDVDWESIYKDDLLIANAGVGYVGWGIGAYGGAELLIAQIKIADVVPLDFGVAGRAGVGLIGGFNLLAGGMATAHITFGGLDLPDFLRDNTDIYLGLGIGFVFGDFGGLGFASIQGINYYLNDTIALNFESGYYNPFGSEWNARWTGTFGLTFKL